MDYLNRLLHRNSPNKSISVSPEPKDSGNEAASIKGEQQPQPQQQQQQQQQQQRDVKVRFIREFADAGAPGIEVAATESSSSLSSASSFQSVASTQSSKCSSGICVDSSPGKFADKSYTNTNIPGLDDLISACENINLDDTSGESAKELSFVLQIDDLRQDLSGDQTFASATDAHSPNRTGENSPIFTNAGKLTRSLDSTSECGSGEFLEASQYSPAKSESVAVEDTFKVEQPASDIAQSEPLLNRADEQELAKKQASCPLDETVDLKQFENIEFLASSICQFAEKNPVEDLGVTETRDSLTTSLSELEGENCQRSSLPKNSITCNKTHPKENTVKILLKKENSADSKRTEEVNVGQSSLSDKCEPILANDYSLGHAISAITEPALLDTRTLVDDNSIGSKGDESAFKIDHTILIADTNTDEITKSVNDFPESFFVESQLEACSVENLDPISSFEERSDEQRQEKEKEKEKEDDDKKSESLIENPVIFEKSAASSEELNATLTIQDISADNIFYVPETDQFGEFRPQQQSTGLVTSKTESFADNTQSPDEYSAFVSQQQSTKLTDCNLLQREETFVTAPPPILDNRIDERNESPIPSRVLDDRCNFDKLELAANAVANDIFTTSLELDEDIEHFVSATNDLFPDPTDFDFLLSKTPKKNQFRDLRTESLYVKFDPLVSNTSMLPQGNIQNITTPPANEERNGDKNETITSIGTPKRNPAIAAIDRLLFYSPSTATSNFTTIQKTNDSQEKLEPSEEETSEETVNMAKELELVRSTVLQLEEQLEKLKIDHEEALEKQSSYQEKVNQLQTQLAQEIKNKNQITVVVDEYEKSISRLVAERERDRKNLDLEKAKLQEELAAAKHHLDNTEAAFNDVHLKYERLKAVVTTYKNNEAALKESLAENVEIIKSLENRYEQVKEHATARLEKANQDLDSIRKQNDSETVRLHAMLRKAELKSNSLAELVEQKAKENKELAKILDEVIARVGRKTE